MAKLQHTQYTQLQGTDELRQLKKRLAFMWVFLLTYSVACTVFSFKIGDCSSASPDSLYYITGGLISASSAWQLWMGWNAANGFMAKLMLLAAIGIGCFVLLDFFTDSQQVSLAALCDASFHDKWLQTFKDASFPAWIVKAVDTLHMAGLLVLSISANIAIQMFLIVMGNVEDEADNLEICCCLVADFVGMGGIIKIVETDDATFKVLTLLRGATVGLFENIPSMYLSTSLFSLTFDDTNESAKAKQLLSWFLSLVATLKLVVDVLLVLWATRKDWKETCDPSAGFATRFWVTMLGLVLPFMYCMVAVAVCIVCGFRIYSSYTCDSHLWNLRSGCVDLA